MLAPWNVQVVRADSRGHWTHLCGLITACWDIMRASRLTHEDMLHDPGRTESQTAIVAAPDSSGAPSPRSFDAIACCAGPYNRCAVGDGVLGHQRIRPARH